IDRTHCFIDITRPVVVAWASNQKARIRAQREPVFSPVGTGSEKWLPRKVTWSSCVLRDDQVTFRKSGGV
ncbi:hypothetical protein, partial [Pseudomonas coronafaciens]|uniref:hypothetical protein n=1 Tax=Pseudomonas coronafaciens TaxID=53409 RepID=UPI00196725B8